MFFIRIAHNGMKMSLGQYTGIVKRVKASVPGTEFKESFCGSWSASREEILAQFGEMVTDKINEHLTIRTLSDVRLLKKMRAHIKSDCRWCGSGLNRYEPKHSRFCDSSCRQDFNN